MSILFMEIMQKHHTNSLYCIFTNIAAHPIKTNRKRKEPSSEMMETQKKKKHKPVPRLSKTARNTQ